MVVYYGLVNVVECICCGCKRDGHFDENNYGGPQFLFSPFDHGYVLAGSKFPTTPRPVLPDIPIPPPDNDIELDLRHQLLETSDNFDLPQTSSDYPTLPSVLEVLIKVGQKTNNYLKEISNQLKRNHDQMEKIEIAVRRSYSHQNVRPVYNHNRYIPPRSPVHQN
jgi:hypothetical protein